jgi:eukaryotic-like serine/threonine-protein kinase
MANHLVGQDTVVGQTLGHYRIVEKIGAGGMGEVYRARDEHLARDVALKVLPEGAFADELARKRFRKEALALSRLNHPNIETVYDFSTQDGIDFLVMEYVSGLTLQHQLSLSVLPEKEVLRLGAQVARALEEAHEHGVIHRDLKPGNILVTPKGQVKVLDFGLAELMEPTDEPLETAASTKSSIVTGGTLRYMAPEILRGQAADARSDIWSMGVVLYEMATGSPPFEATTNVELISAILRDDAEPLPAHISPVVRTVICKCLAKEPSQRYQHAGEIRASLEALISDSGILTLPSSVPPLRRVVVAAIVMLTVLLVVAVVAIVMWRRSASRAGIGPGGQLNLLLSSEGEVENPTISADGKMLAFVAQDHGQWDLYASRVAGGARVRLTNDTAREGTPTFSPDGDRIAFARRRPGAGQPEICIIPTLGGDVVPVITGGANPSWSPDGKQFAFLSVRPGQPVALAISDLDGSNPRILLTVDGTYPFIQDPAWSPDGKLLAVIRSTGGVAGEIWLVPTEGGHPRRLTSDPRTIFSHRPVFTSDASGIVHSSNRGGATNLWIAPVDGSSPHRITTGPGPDEAPTVARDGTIAFVSSRWRYSLVLHDLNKGENRDLLTYANYIWAPAFSPDGREIAFSRFETDGLWHVWVVDVDGNNPRQLTSTSKGEIYARFTHDGSSLVYMSWSGDGHIWRVPRNGGPPVAITDGASGGDAYPEVSPNGRWLAFVRNAEDKARLYLAPVDGGPARLLVDSPSTLPHWSPDGGWILYSPDRSMRGGLFLVRPDGSGKKQIHPTGGWGNWFPDGKKIAYVDINPQGNQEIFTVLAVGGAAKLITELNFVGTNYPFDISPDGRLLVTSNSIHFQDEVWLLHPAGK